MSDLHMDGRREATSKRFARKLRAAGFSGSLRSLADTVDATFELLAEEVESAGIVRAQHLGVFEAVDRPPRRHHNPRSGEMEVAPPRTTVVFRPSSDLRRRLNGA